MSTASAPSRVATDGDTDADHPTPPADAIQRLEQLFSDATLCTWCFDRKRIPYEEYDQLRINAKDQDRNSGAIDHMAFVEFERQDDGSLQVIKASSGRDPRTWKEVVPPKTDQYGQILEVARSKTICSDCAEIDIDPTQSRDRRMKLMAVENIADHYEREGRAFHLKAAKMFVHELLDQDGSNHFASADRDLLAFAIDVGERYGDG